jgi:hypothetical protein
MTLLLRIVHAVSPTFFRLGQNVHALASKQGQLRSIRERRPVRSDGSAIPWYTYPAIEYLSQFDFSNASVFEFGAGYSSLYWAQRARTVLSVESDPGWLEHLKEGVRPNQKVLLRQGRDDYVNAIREQPDLFDVVIVDGRWRHACVEAAMNKVRDDGLIVLDNSDRYPKATRCLRDSDRFQVDFSGFGPVNNYAWTTSIFLRAACRLQKDFAPPLPIAGLGRSLGPQDEG